jgi:hypothetical protein
VTALPKHVISFLVAHVDHRVKLDLVLFLHRVSAVTPMWIAASELELSKAQVRDMADELARDGLVRVEGDRFELAPRTIDDRLAILDLATWYTLDRGRILDVLRTLGRNR